MIGCAEMSYQRYTGMIHACVCVWEEGRGGGSLVSVSEPPCMFVFVIRVTARRFSLPKDKNEVLE